MIDGRRNACALGLVNRVVPVRRAGGGDRWPLARPLPRDRRSRRGQGAQSLADDLARPEAAIAREEDCAADCFRSHDAAEGLAAFIEKRTPCSRTTEEADIMRRINNFDDWIDYFHFWQDSIGVAAKEFKGSAVSEEFRGKSFATFNFDAKFGEPEAETIEFGHYKGRASGRR